ncbi:MAG: YncE family protein, partial [Bacteroidia bacterium]|nr:YncE family protein [Bacteroidia bacterium]
MSRNGKIFLPIALVLAACSEKNTVEPDEKFESGLYIVNEGNFDWGEGTLTYWNPETGEIRDDVFRKTNGRTLGNVAQSMSRIGNLGYIVVNNSQKIEVVDIHTCKSEFVITG